MNFLDCIYQLIIGPLKLVFEFIFVKAYSMLGNPGLAIIFLSLAMNILVLPLYRRADKMQEDVRDKEKSLEPWVSHIKKTFSGNEQMMMMSTYYRQRGYKPIYALKGSVSLLLEVPFFVAAYSFLSELEILSGTSFGPISDLGSPDRLINFFGISVNFLPILMTIINVIAAAIYLKGFPLKNKIQMYGIAAIFLVLLYDSPAGLVFYWTLNNLFSLGKNIFYKLKNPGKVLSIGLSAIGWIVLAFGLVNPFDRFNRQIIVYVAALALQIPLVISIVKKHSKKGLRGFKIREVSKTENRIFIACCTFLALLTGVLIPSTLINYSTFEFISSYNSISPMWYIASASLYAAGFFLVWFGIFYYLASPKVKTVFSYLMLTLSVVAVVNYMFFGTNYGNLSAVLVFDNEPHIPMADILINGAVIVALIVGCFFALKKAKIVKTVCYVLCFAILCMSVINMVGIGNNLNVIQNADDNDLAKNTPEIPLSSDGKNVVVLMMDKAVSTYVPYLLNEKPELQEQFAGFTYYPNTLSSGGNTLVGLPAVFGGYEYTPDETNKRDDMTLAQKHDEALRVMPEIFSNHQYDITIGNPTFAGYTYNMDLSVFDEIENAKTFKTKGKLSSGLQEADELISAETQHTQLRNFFTYSLFKCSPVALQPQIYTSGNYFSSRVMNGSISSQELVGSSKAHGLTEHYLDSYSVLVNLKEITNIRQTNRNSFFMLCNELTHSPLMLQMPDYTPALEVDNTEYDKNGFLKQSAFEDETIELTNADQVIHYHVNMEAFLLLGEWFDYLRENGVYDNTRIILVSDHGYNLGYDEDKFDTGVWDDISRYRPILLVKDFNSTEFTVNDQLMTNADVPTLAFEGLVENPKNPFTGKLINSEAKENMEYMNLYVSDPQPSNNSGSVFSNINKAMVTITDDLFNSEFWEHVN